MVAVVAGVLVACSCCCVSQVGLPLLLATVFGDRLAETFESPALVRTTVPNEVAWAGGGDYAVIQSCDASGTARVVVWERATGKTRVLDRHRLIAAEEATAAVWVAADSEGPAGEPDPYTYQIPTASQDDRTTTPQRVRLTGAELEPRSGYGEWEPWPSPMGFVARMGVEDPEGAAQVERAFPVTLTISAGGKPLRDIELGPVESFRPLGWSASGRYFAVLSLVEPGDDDWPEVIVVDAVTGKEQSRDWVLDSHFWDGAGVSVVWDGDDDRIWWFEPGEADNDTDAPGDGVLQSVGTDGISAAAPVPDPRSDGAFAGPVRDGALWVSTEGSIRSWLVDGEGTRRLGRRAASGTGVISCSTARLSSRGDLLFAVLRPGKTGGFVREVYVSDADLKHERVIWREETPNPVMRALGLDRPTER